MMLYNQGLSAMSRLPNMNYTTLTGYILYARCF